MLLSRRPPSTPIYPYANQSYAEALPAYHGDPNTELTNIETPLNYSSQGGIAGRAQLAGFDDGFLTQHPEKNTEEPAWLNQYLTFDRQVVESSNVDILSYQDLSWITNDSFLQIEPECQNRRSNPPGVLFNSPETYTCNSPSIDFDDSLPPFTGSTGLFQPIEIRNSVYYGSPFSFPIGDQNLGYFPAPWLQRSYTWPLDQMEPDEYDDFAEMGSIQTPTAAPNVQTTTAAPHPLPTRGSSLPQSSMLDRNFVRQNDHPSNVVQCRECGKIFGGDRCRKANLDRHERTVHNKEGKRFRCRLRSCSLSYKREDSLMSHERTHDELRRPPPILRQKKGGNSPN